MRKINIGIIGLGNQGKIHLNNCLNMKDVNVLGVADVSRNALKLAEKKGIRNTYLNYEDLLKNNQIDSVIISLPNYLHTEATIKAAEAGKDVLLEKPLARNVSEGRLILSSAQKYGIKLMLGYEMRFIKSLMTLHDEIAGGYFGEVQFADVVNVSGGPLSSRGEGARPLAVPPWWFDKEKVGGGALLDLGSHLINLLNWYFGEVKDVKAFIGFMYNMDVEDVATCILKYKNGPLASIRVGWFSKGFFQSVQVCGTAKNVSLNLAPLSIFRVISGDIKTKLGWHKNKSIYSEIEYFIDCLRKDVNPSPSGEDGLRDLQVIELAYKTASRLDKIQEASN